MAAVSETEKSYKAYLGSNSVLMCMCMFAGLLLFGVISTQKFVMHVYQLLIRCVRSLCRDFTEQLAL
jgi:hypothetical protein